jgi:hypothetical protein
VLGVAVASVVAAVAVLRIPAFARLVGFGTGLAGFGAGFVVGLRRGAGASAGAGAVGIVLGWLGRPIVGLSSIVITRRRGIGNGQRPAKTTQEQAGCDEAGRRGAEHTRTHVATTFQGVTGQLFTRPDNSGTTMATGFAVE